MIVIGIDASTFTGYSVQNSEVLATNVHGEKSFPGMTGIARVIAFSNWFLQLLENVGPDLVVFEAYAHVHPATLEALIAIGTLLRVDCHLNGIPFVEVSPTALKKFVTGVGSAKKEQMLMATYKRWGIEFKSNNTCDAYGLAKIGLSLLGVGDELTQIQKQVIDSLNKDYVSCLNKILSKN